MLLYSAQVTAGSPQELYAARMPKGMWMKLGEPYLLTQSRDHLEDPVVSHSTDRRLAQRPRRQGCCDLVTLREYR
jgi:hypothetical protein